ncbi:hypothetical protein JG688_00005866 [Phytophthora aleatoria]|uniref:Uncharacterized protein n=1 Tax=Phytophthora aleatoria TaxID=2496075 RepID=A0A8J5M689_9STRA|nr:hypothetical protein JG688_00005866 [Phytophthora aleatoria]
MLTINGFTCAKTAIRTTLPVTRQRTVTKNKNHHTKVSFYVWRRRVHSLKNKGARCLTARWGVGLSWIHGSHSATARIDRRHPN